MKKLFPEQNDQEKIYLLTRAHWLTLLPKFIVWLIFSSFPIVFDLFVVANSPTLLEPQAQNVINFFKSIYLMISATALFAIWVLYYLNYQIVTNERLVDVDQRGFLHHQSSELHLSDVQDVTVEVKGVLGTFFDFGTVFVQTAGTTKQFEFDLVAHPHLVAKLILALQENFKTQAGTKRTV